MAAGWRRIGEANQGWGYKGKVNIKNMRQWLTYSNVAYKNIGGQARKNNTSKRTKINNWNTNGNTLKQSAKGSKYKEGSKKY